MKRFFTILVALFCAITAVAQAEKSIIIDASKFRPVQSDALTGYSIDAIPQDHSRRPCARLKVKINRMTVEDIDGIQIKVATNNEVMRCQTAAYDLGLIVEMTAKPNTRFYFHHKEYGDSNEVCLNLEPNKEYYLEAYLNQTFSIVVNSNVVGADVYIDGQYKGQTSDAMSLTVSDVMIGDHTLKLTYGKSECEQTITVNKNSIAFRQNINTQASKPQYVVFAVEPQSAVVTIAGNHYPLTEGSMMLVLESGTYNYTVSAAGYHSQSGTFTVAGSKVEKSVSLKADAATVTLIAPDGAEIWVNGTKRGTSRWSGTLTSGTYIFESRKEGHRTASISQKITSDKPQQSYTLPAPTPMLGTVVVGSTPLMADVALDGKVVGRTPIDLESVIVGKHTISISKSGYNDFTQTITVAEGKSTTVNVTLTNQSATPTSITSAEGLTFAPYKVGDYYNDGKKEGVVFEVSADGQHGKIVSMTQSRRGLQWSSDEAEQKRLIGADSNSDGAYNMAKVKAVANWQEKYPAFKWCADLGEGWYLPSIEELEKFASDDAVHDAVNRTLTSKGGEKLFNRGDLGWYWSSTESNKQYDGKFCPWSVGMGSGYTGNLGKNRSTYVRAVSAF